MSILYIAAVLLALIAILYLALGLGAPFGFLAWGGKYNKVLPKQLRTQSLVSIPAQLFAMVVLLTLGTDPTTFIIVFGYLYLVFFTINVVMNLLSHSKLEKMIMTPIALFIVFAFVYGLFIY